VKRDIAECDKSEQLSTDGNIEKEKEIQRRERERRERKGGKRERRNGKWNLK